MQLAPGARLGQYEIPAFIGRGGTGDVWRARDSRLERGVAVKALMRDIKVTWSIWQQVSPDLT
jgi:hypothetical protein